MTKVKVVQSIGAGSTALATAEKEANKFMEYKDIVSVDFQMNLVPGVGNRCIFTIVYKD